MRVQLQEQLQELASSGLPPAAAGTDGAIRSRVRPFYVLPPSISNAHLRACDPDLDCAMAVYCIDSDVEFEFRTLAFPIWAKFQSFQSDGLASQCSGTPCVRLLPLHSTAVSQFSCVNVRVPRGTPQVQRPSRDLCRTLYPGVMPDLFACWLYVNPMLKVQICGGPPACHASLIWALGSCGEAVP